MNRINTEIVKRNFLNSDMRKFIKILIYLLLIPGLNVFAGKENNIWYFGRNAGLDFNFTPPVVLLDGKINTREGVATLSDTNGNLLLYTDGVILLNKNHLMVRNGNGLLGHGSSTQSAILVPKPGNYNLVYLFTVDAIENNNNGLRYSIIDINKDSVITKNVFLCNTVEKIAAVPQGKENGAWIICHESGTDAFFAYSLTDKGIDTNPVISNTGSVYSDKEWTSPGCLKVSQNGKRIATTIYGYNRVEVFDFDDITGCISNPLFLDSFPQSSAYGVEFSPDGTKLYVSITQCGLYQFNLQGANENEIKKSITEIRKDNLYFGSLQFAPDGKIYLAIENQNKLAIIHEPNALGLSCGFDITGINLQGRNSSLGLPNMILRTKSNFIVRCGSNSPVCVADTIELWCSANNAVTYCWTGPNSYISNMQNPKIPNVTELMSGIYYVRIADSVGIIMLDSVSVKVNDTKLQFDSASSYQFGKVCLGMQKSGIINIKNTGNEAVLLSRCYFKNGNRVFKIMSDTANIRIQTGTVYPLQIQYTPDRNGDFSDSIIIISNSPCKRMYSLIAGGSCIEKTIVSLPDTTVNINDTLFCIPLSAKLLCNSNTDNSSVQYIAEIRWNQGLFLAHSITNGTIIENRHQDGEQILKFSASGYEGEPDNACLTKICGMPMLGSSFQTPLNITSFEFKDSTVSVEKIDGSLTITGVCAGKLRLITFEDIVQFEVAPNPVTDNFTITTNSKEYGIVKIFSVEGIEIKTLSFDFKISNKVSINTGDMSSGIYFISIETKIKKAIKVIALIK
jgi:DNA-binding beta-propeller fold protein YncE